jgi:acyl-ACP thioesterase
MPISRIVKFSASFEHTKPVNFGHKLIIAKHVKKTSKHFDTNKN